MLMPLQCLAQSQTLSPEVEECRTVVQNFYGWYVRLENTDAPKQTEAPLERAIRQKRDLFSAELIGLVEQADVEQRRVDDAGIDFDPILNTQDAADRYITERVTVTGERCYAEIHAAYPPTRRKDYSKPDVIAELSRTNHRWRFVNFHYPDNPPEWADMKSALRTYIYAPAKPPQN